jgi:hypothetical protein
LSGRVGDVVGAARAAGNLGAPWVRGWGLGVWVWDGGGDQVGQGPGALSGRLI